MQQALQVQFQKNQETAQQLAQLRQEMERVKVDHKQGEEEMTETFMNELKEAEAKLEAKQ